MSGEETGATDGTEENGAAAVDGNKHGDGNGERTAVPEPRGQEQECGSPEPGPVPDRVPVLRRLLRSRTARAVTAAGLVGALLGAGAVAWRTDALPSAGPAPCWDSLSDATVSGLFGDRRTEVEEQSLQADPRDGKSSYGQCRVTSYKNDWARRQMTVRVHRLDGLEGTDAHEWPREYLAAGLVSLGDGLPGMTSSTRAWLALPQSCTGRDEFTGPTVVDVAMGRAGLEVSSEIDQKDRAALTRAVVEATNGAIREFGCSGAYRAPRDLPSLVAQRDTEADAFCGIKGLTLPPAYRKSLVRTRVGGDGGPARICEAGGRRTPKLRMTTVTDAALTEIFSRDVLRAGLSVKGAKGYGRFDGSRALYRASCQTGPVVFMVEQLEPVADGDFGLTRALLPGYVAAEAERIGCGPLKVTLPGA
ncbi:hypothetical protein OG298_32895 [Streptomyces sp. NBC_01005]|uniref:hypothetical protein n=1 Tax=unclassified Streptomyces TaxID=2593676 RepID=UPI003865112A|nr:hypothetical protein OG298_32895 [Streptomyces sp. NBC_01005]WTC98300.1 hypothetical protein OH736_32900 [Streptomyces sp. NBC_01650]